MIRGKTQRNMMKSGVSRLALVSLLLCKNVISLELCYNDTESLNAAMVDDGLSQKTYHVCPNTHIKTGFFDPNSGLYENGEFPINPIYSGAKVLCGLDGNIDNNCTFSDGEAAVEIIYPTFAGGTELGSTPGKINFHIEGFTFTNITGRVIYSYYSLLTEVTLTVKNCRFVDNKALDLIFVQTDTADKEEIIVEDSDFINNVMYYDINLSSGMVTFLIGGFNDPIIMISRSKFLNNHFDDTTTQKTIVFGSSQNQAGGSAIVSMTDSCIEGNIGLLNNLLLSSQPADPGIRLNNYQASNSFASGAVICYGLATVNGVCLDTGFDASRCTADDPTPAPTHAPTPAPTPNAVDTVLSSKTGEIFLMLSSVIFMYFF